MKVTKNLKIILIVFCILMMLMSSTVLAGVGASQSSVTVRQNCSCNSYF